VLWKQILAASVITVLGAGILVGGSALVLHTPALRPKGGFIVLASACVGLLSMAGGIGWLGFASYASHFRSKALKYMREGEESYKGDRNKLYTICEACSRFFSKGELTPEEIALWRQARKHLQPFVAQEEASSCKRLKSIVYVSCWLYQVMITTKMKPFRLL
jgi:hypothetical protein